MLGSNLIKNVLSLVVIIAIVYLSFNYVTRPLDNSADATNISVTSSATASSTGNLANIFAVLLDKLSTVDFQKGNQIFDNPIFQNGLISFSRELPIIDKTRPNPFAPIDGNPVLYVHYLTPAIVPLSFSTSSRILPIATTTATTSKKK